MWYLVDLLFTQPESESKQMYFCETCNVLFEAESSNEAYAKAIHWAEEHIIESLYDLTFLGITYISDILETPGDGVEICGRFLRMKDPWLRKDQLIKKQEETLAAQWESNANKTIGEALAEKRGKQFVATMIKAQKKDTKD